MNSAAFRGVIMKTHFKALEILKEKEKHYGSSHDRLIQFKTLAEETGKHPTECLVDMAQKHWSAIREMAKNPQSYDMEVWEEHCLDLCNYAGPLMLGLLVDMYGGEL